MHLNSLDVGFLSIYSAVAQFFPKLKKYDGIKALKESPYLLQIQSEASG